jgi:hypothetical protein
VKPPSRKLPFAPLRDALGDVYTPSADACRGNGDERFYDRKPPALIKQGKNTVLAERLGVSRRTINRWVRDGIPVEYSDDAAVALGLLPYEVWPDWNEDEILYHSTEWPRPDNWEAKPHACAVDGCRCDRARAKDAA